MPSSYNSVNPETTSAVVHPRNDPICHYLLHTPEFQVSSTQDSVNCPTASQFPHSFPLLRFGTPCPSKHISPWYSIVQRSLHFEIFNVSSEADSKCVLPPE